MATLNPHRLRAFSLIELLVVLGIIGLLIALLAPILAYARIAAQSLSCAANQKQMYIAWKVVLNERDQVIPNTASPSGDRWDTLVLQAMNIEIDRPSISCPLALKTYGLLEGSAGRTTYGINIRWEENGPVGDNQGRNWDNLFQPATYPIFSDTDAYTDLKPATIYDEIGRECSPSGIGPDRSFRMGFFHPEETANVTWGDGSVNNNSTALLDGLTDDNGVPLVFFNRPRGSGAIAMLPPE